MEPQRTIGQPTVVETLWPVEFITTCKRFVSADKGISRTQICHRRNWSNHWLHSYVWKFVNFCMFTIVVSDRFFQQSCWKHFYTRVTHCVKLPFRFTCKTAAFVTSRVGEHTRDQTNSRFVLRILLFNAAHRFQVFANNAACIHKLWVCFEFSKVCSRTANYPSQ